MRSAVPKLLARLVPAAPGIGAHLVVRCDWCEENHTHSSAPGHRAAHCSCADSPYLATGYALCQAPGGDLGAVPPEALYLGHRRLRDDLARIGSRHRSTLLALMLGVRTRGHYSKRVGRARLNVFDDTWIIDPDAFLSEAEMGADLLPQRSAAVGRDFITLFSALYGVARGIVGVRLLEAVSGRSFDAEGRRAIAAEIDAACARGAEGEGASP